MILALGVGAAVALIGYREYKHYGTAAIVAAVKAEVSKIEGEVVSGTLLATVKADALAVVARLKALL